MDERPTVLLPEIDTASTRRLEPRPTGPEPADARIAPPSVNITSQRKIGSKAAVLFIVVAVVVIVTAIAIVKSRNKVASAEGLIYPGSTELLNMVVEGGGRAIQLETLDSVQKVEVWYQKSMKPGKAIQLTSNSVILKNEKTTVTIVSENYKTSILIKIVP